MKTFFQNFLKRCSLNIQIALVTFWGGLFFAISCSESHIHLSSIQIQPGKLNAHPVLSCMDSVSYIPLETPAKKIMGEITKIIPFRDRYYLIDGRTSQSVFCYSRNGKLLFQLRNIGKGPGEYGMLADFTLDKERGYLEILDPSQQKMIRYSPEGQYISEVFCPYDAVEIAKADTAEYVLYTTIDNTRQAGESLAFNLLWVDTQGKVLAKAFPYLGVIHELGFWGRLVKGEEYLLFNYGLSNTIYQLKNRQAVPLYQVDFGKSTFPFDARNKTLSVDEMERFVMELYESDYAYGLYLFAETNRYLSFCYRYKNRSGQWALYAKASQKAYNFPIEGVDNELFAAPIAAEGDAFIGAVASHRLKQLVADAEKKGLPVSQRLKRLAQNRSDFDNPVLVRMYIHNF
ncbi:MAG: 6-bladed beta-propeller [Bacteroidetes bacterium]|nr:MAG: 6-bladed beta-propeller [Bacteroidota bacterium]